MTNENSNREVKSSAFTTFFSVPENAAKLYQALNQVEVSPEEITFTTLSGVLFMARKNEKLSDAYLEKTDTPMLELTVRVININLPVNHPILKKCRPLERRR